MRYVFSEIPATEEGELLIALMKKYLNKKNYKLRISTIKKKIYCNTKTKTIKLRYPESP